MPPNKWDEESDEENDTKPTVAIRAAKSKWAEEEEDDVAESWDAEASDSEEERKKAAKASALAAKEAAEKKSRKERIAEKQASNAAKKAAEEEERSKIEDETPEDRKKRQQQREIEADMKHAEDLFAGVLGSARGSGTSTPMGKSGSIAGDDIVGSTGDVKRKAISVMDPSDAAKSIDLSLLPMFTPTTKDQFTNLRNILEPLLTANTKKAHYPLFVQEFVRALVKEMSSEQMKKVASTVTTLANEKMKEEKAAEKGGKKNTKAKSKASLANVTKESDKVDMSSYTEAYDDFDDFM